MKKSNELKKLSLRVLGIVLILLLGYTIFSMSTNGLMRTVAHKSYGIKNISSIEKQSRAPSLFILTGTDVNGNTRFIWFFKPNGEKVYDVYSIMSNEGLSKSEALKKAHEVLGNFKEKNISLIFDPLTIGDLKQNLLIKSNVYWFIVLDGNAYGKGYILVDFFTGKAVYSSH